MLRLDPVWSDYDPVRYESNVRVPHTIQKFSKKTSFLYQIFYISVPDIFIGIGEMYFCFKNFSFYYWIFHQNRYLWQNFDQRIPQVFVFMNLSLKFSINFEKVSFCYRNGELEIFSSKSFFWQNFEQRHFQNFRLWYILASNSANFNRFWKNMPILVKKSVLVYVSAQKCRFDTTGNSIYVLDNV